MRYGQTGQGRNFGAAAAAAIAVGADKFHLISRGAVDNDKNEYIHIA